MPDRSIVGHEYGNRHFRREFLGEWDGPKGPCDIEKQRMRGLDLNCRDYKRFWYDANSRPILWPGITDDHLANIIKMVKREGWYSGNCEPWQRAAYNMAHVEMNKRLKAREAKPMNYTIKLPDGVQVKEELMNYETKDNSYPMPDRPEIATESLPQYFGRKVKLGNGKKGKVVGIYHPDYQEEHTYRHQLRVRIVTPGMKPSYVLTDANQVELVEVLTVYAYQAKNGTIEWTSKVYTPTQLKSRSLKKLPNATKYIDLD